MIVDPMLIALPVSVVVLVVFTFFTPRHSAEHIEKCFNKIG
jgi:hypothetical protein